MKILTKEDAATVLRFQRYFFYEVWKKMLKLAWFPALMAIICIVFDSYFMAGFILFFYIVLIAVFPLINKKSADDLNKSNKLMMESKLCEYEMNENCFYVRAYQDDEMVAMTKYKYEQIFKVEESEMDVYIFIANNQALCVSKSDIDENDMSELRGLLQGKVVNYKIKKARRK